MARTGDYRGRGAHDDPWQASPDVPQWVAYAAILIWVFFAAALWLNYLRKPPKD